MNEVEHGAKNIFYYLRFLEQFVVHAEEPEEEFYCQLSFQLESFIRFDVDVCSGHDDDT